MPPRPNARPRPHSRSRRPALPSLLVLALLGGCAGARLPSEAAPMTTRNPADGYILESGNRVRIVVFGENGLSGDYQIDPVGQISLPLAGTVPAAGVTAEGLGQRIGALLQRGGYMRDPRVSIEVETFRPFYVLGEVRQPGEFPYMTGMTVLGAVAKAGGYDNWAYEDEVKLVRIVNGTQHEYRANEQTPILPGDIIRVVERNL